MNQRFLLLLGVLSAVRVLGCAEPPADDAAELTSFQSKGEEDNVPTTADPLLDDLMTRAETEHTRDPNDVDQPALVWTIDRKEPVTISTKGALSVSFPKFDPTTTAFQIQSDERPILAISISPTNKLDVGSYSCADLNGQLAVAFPNEGVMRTARYPNTDCTVTIAKRTDEHIGDTRFIKRTTFTGSAHGTVIDEAGAQHAVHAGFVVVEQPR